MSKKKHKRKDSKGVQAELPLPTLDHAPEAVAENEAPRRAVWLWAPGVIIMAAGLFARGTAPLLIAVGATVLAGVLAWQARTEYTRDDLDVGPAANLYLWTAGAAGVTAGSWLFFLITLAQ